MTRHFALPASIALLCAALSACAGAQEQQSLMPSEAVVACEDLLTEFSELHTESSSEETLVDAMQRAEAAAESCSEHFGAVPTGEGDEILFAHRSDQLRFFALYFEAALSRRFDDYANFCPILQDMARLLLEGITAEQQALDSGNLTPEGVRKVRELLELDVQTLELVGIQMSARCG